MTVAHVYEAINQVTAVMAGEGIAKGRKNLQQNYTFRGIDDVYSALARPLADAKLCILPRVMSRETSERATKSGGVSFYVVLDVEFDFVSAVDGSKHTIRTVGEAMDTADKATNKAMSAAMKYACLMTFQIPTEGDNDADSSHHERVPAQPQNPVRGNDLVSQLAASIDWTEWEASNATLLRTSRNISELQERWGSIYEAGKRSPNGLMRRLATVKDTCKATFNGHASP